MAEVFSQHDIASFGSRFRVNFINSLSGFKSANIVGTQSLAGINNAALFSSAVHIGADPALIGLISRPDVVPRDTLKNIQDTGQFTLNHVHEGIFKQAHHTSARFDADESEFDACGLTAEFVEGFAAPLVAESHIKMTLSLAEIIPIKLNGTYMVIGKVEHVILPESIVAETGHVDIEAAGTLAVSGLDAYHETSLIERLAYAKKGVKP